MFSAKLLLGNSNLADVNSARQLRKHRAPVVQLTKPRRVHKKGGGRPKKNAAKADAAAPAPAADVNAADDANSS